MREIIWLEDIVEKLEKKHSVRQNEVIEVLERIFRAPKHVFYWKMRKLSLF